MDDEQSYNADLAKRILLHAGLLCERLATQAAGAGTSMLRGEEGQELVERSRSVALLTEAAVALFGEAEHLDLD